MSLPQVSTAVEYFAWCDSQGPGSAWTSSQKTLQKKLFKSLPRTERNLVLIGRGKDREKFFIKENRGETSEKVSPSGKYRLEIARYGTTKGAWDYSRGEVFRISDGVQVADVKRNYSSFPFFWMEDHHNGHDYLVCGTDYQGLTFCELDTGKMATHIPDAAFEGGGFCAADFSLLLSGKILVVVGCIWACPYEYRLYDVSDPLTDCPEIRSKDFCLDYEEKGKTSLVEEDGLLLWGEGSLFFKKTGESEHDIETKWSHAFDLENKAQKAKDPALIEEAAAAVSSLERDYPDKEDSPESWEVRPDLRRSFRISGSELVLVEEWKSEDRLKKDQLHKEWEEKTQKDMREWMASPDSLWSFLAEISGGGPDFLRKRTHFMYPSWNARENGEKNPAFFSVSGRAYDPDVSYNHSFSLEWGVKSGDITLETWVRGEGSKKSSFPRSQEGIIKAWDAGHMHLQAEVLS